MKSYLAPHSFVIFIFSLLALSVQSQEIVFSKGVVKVAPSSSDVFVSFEKGKIQYGNVVRTGEDGLAIVSFPEGSKLKIDPNSEVEIGPREKADASSDIDASWNLKVLKGALTIDFIKKSEGEKLYVESDQFAVGVRGTRFLVAKETSNDWHVAVNEGQVTAFNKESYDYEDIKSGQGLVLEKGSNLTKPANFEWTKKLDWDVSPKGRASKFFSKELRSKRRSEVKSRLKKLRQRKKKLLQGKLRKTLKERMKKRGLKRKGSNKERNTLRNRLKNRKSQGSNERKNKKDKKLRRQKKSTPQNFRDRMRKRKVLRRRRN